MTIGINVIVDSGLIGTKAEVEVYNDYNGVKTLSETIKVNQNENSGTIFLDDSKFIKVKEIIESTRKEE